LRRKTQRSSLESNRSCSNRLQRSNW